VKDLRARYQREAAEDDANYVRRRLDLLLGLGQAEPTRHRLKLSEDLRPTNSTGWTPPTLLAKRQR